MADVPVALILARAENGVIGRAGGLPWHLSGDLKFFKAQTMGKPLVMGRKTYQSIGKPLPGRPNLAISRDPGFRPEGVEVFADLAAALVRAETLVAAMPGEGPRREIMVIGGGQIYAQALPLAERIYLTEVHAVLEGDTFFSELDPAEWREVSRDPQPSPGEGQPGFSFVILERVRPTPSTQPG
ncbi:dihydrofolate reductase [Pelagibius sp.]|uniref:dihydrofolate reductase n=1 Tax=Pelagibius sp. TaxID=1931238 RepID=UPI002629D507|nr:dihydrofolate reductase [Pelagibius sp.]